MSNLINLDMKIQASDTMLQKVHVILVYQRVLSHSDVLTISTVRIQATCSCQCFDSEFLFSTDSFISGPQLRLNGE